MTFTNKILWYSLIVAHLRLIDTHIHTDSISLSCPSRDSPIGPCHLKKNEEDREVWKCCLDPAIMPTVKSLVCVCVWITFCLPACLLAQIVRRLVYLRACVHAFWQYPRLPRKRLSGDRPHAATLPRGVRMLFPPNKVMTSRLWFRLPAQNHTGYRADSSGPS